MAGEQRFVYVLKSAREEGRLYVGMSADVAAKLADHNAGRCPQTAARRPWRLHVVILLPDELHAKAFERYLKTSAGRMLASEYFA